MFRDIFVKVHKNISDYLDHSSLKALSQTHRFFTPLITTYQKKEAYINKIIDDLYYNFNNLSLEKIEEYLDFVEKESSIHQAIRCLNIVIAKTSYQLDDPTKKYSSDKLNFLSQRLKYLKEQHLQRFGLYGQLYLVLDRMYSTEERCNIDALVFMHMIKLSSANPVHDLSKTIPLLNEYNQLILNIPNLKITHLIYGKQDVLITMNKDKQIRLLGESIDHWISFYLQKSVAKFNEEVKFPAMMKPFLENQLNQNYLSNAKCILGDLESSKQNTKSYKL